MMDERFTLACDAWLAAWTGNRVDALLAWYTDDCLYADPLCRQGLVGKGALRAHLTPLLARHPDWHFRLRFCSDTRSGLCVVWTISFTKCRLPTRVGSAELILRGGLILHQQSVFETADLCAPAAVDGASSIPCSATDERSTS